jgi:phosphoribosyl-AMP cyclohydrolase
MDDLEEGSALELDFAKLRKVASGSEDVVAAVIQDDVSGTVLFVGYTNELAFEETLRTGRVVLWSTSRHELWRKGDTSGDVLDLVEARVNCEQNSLLYLVRPRGGGACHTRGGDGRTRFGCYYRRVTAGDPPLELVDPARAGGEDH